MEYAQVLPLLEVAEHVPLKGEVLVDRTVVGPDAREEPGELIERARDRQLPDFNIGLLRSALDHEQLGKQWDLF